MSSDGRAKGRVAAGEGIQQHLLERVWAKEGPKCGKYFFILPQWKREAMESRETEREKAAQGN